MRRCHSHCHNSCRRCGVIPIPMADTIPITGAQMTMIMGLAKVFDIPMTQAAAQSILRYDGQSGGSQFSNIIKGIPGVGTVVGGVISAGTSVALTETLGWIVAEDFYKQSIGLGSDSPLEAQKMPIPVSVTLPNL